MVLEKASKVLHTAWRKEKLKPRTKANPDITFELNLCRDGRKICKNRMKKSKYQFFMLSQTNVSVLLFKDQRKKMNGLSKEHCFISSNSPTIYEFQSPHVSSVNCNLVGHISTLSLFFLQESLKPWTSEEGTPGFEVYLFCLPGTFSYLDPLSFLFSMYQKTDINNCPQWWHDNCQERV